MVRQLENDLNQRFKMKLWILKLKWKWEKWNNNYKVWINSKILLELKDDNDRLRRGGGGGGAGLDYRGDDGGISRER